MYKTVYETCASFSLYQNRQWQLFLSEQSDKDAFEGCVYNNEQAEWLIFTEPTSEVKGHLDVGTVSNTWAYYINPIWMTFAPKVSLTKIKTDAILGQKNQHAPTVTG